MKKIAFLFTIFIACYACEKVNINKEIVNSDLLQTIEIPVNSILKVNLGNFGDEEGAHIYRNPRNAIKSEIERTASVVYYKYIPIVDFIGADTAIITLNRGSDGTNPGESEMLSIIINVIKIH